MAERKTTTTETATEARQGSTEHVVRYVLGIGLPLAIVGMIVAYLFMT